MRRIKTLIREDVNLKLQSSIVDHQEAAERHVSSVSQNTVWRWTGGGVRHIWTQWNSINCLFIQSWRQREFVYFKSTNEHLQHFFHNTTDCSFKCSTVTQWDSLNFIRTSRTNVWLIQTASVLQNIIRTAWLDMKRQFDQIKRLKTSKKEKQTNRSNRVWTGGG